MAGEAGAATRARARSARTEGLGEGSGKHGAEMDEAPGPREIVYTPKCIP